MREKLARFMYGRYGVNDELSKFLLVSYIVLLILSSILGVVSSSVGIVGIVGRVLNWAALLLVIWCFYRLLSRNIYARQQENRKYLEFKSRVTGIFARRKYRDARYRYFKCPGCKQKVRVPKGHGHIEITCPRCRTKFVKNS